MNQKLWRAVRPVVRPVGGAAIAALFYLLRVVPIKQNKVIACVSIGRRYDDNQKYIMEELHRLCPEADIVWVTDPKYGYELPQWMRTVRWRTLRWIYEYATAKVWTNNCTEPGYFVKRKGQLYVETWHGGLGIKKVAEDVTGEMASHVPKVWYAKNVADKADVYISNSDHLTKIYRTGFKDLSGSAAIRRTICWSETTLRTARRPAGNWVSHRARRCCSMRPHGDGGSRRRSIST